MAVTIVRGDVTDQDVDAVVNAANEQLVGGSGVCGRIFERAGWQQMADACAALGGCPTGEARTTPGFALAARWVIHAVGPVWRGGRSGEEDLLRRAYRSALGQAERVGAASIAFPVLSTGVYGYPLDAGCRVAVETLRDTPTSVTDIRIVAFDDATWRAFEQLGASSPASRSPSASPPGIAPRGSPVAPTPSRCTAGGKRPNGPTYGACAGGR